MKRFILGTLAAVLISMMNVFAESTIQKAYYVDFKNGDVQVLWTDWVDSMSVSKIGIDSVVNPKYVTQEIWMSDTVLRFPLDSIERISFVTPSPEFKEGVVRFEDGLENYIIGCDSLTVLLATDTPEKLIPRPGTKVCYLKMTEIFPAAFAGEVKEVRKKSDMIEMECGLTSLTDIFKTYYSTYFEEEEENTLSRADYSDPVFKHHITTPITIHFGEILNMIKRQSIPAMSERKRQIYERIVATTPTEKKEFYKNFLAFANNSGNQKDVALQLDYTLSPDLFVRIDDIIRELPTPSDMPQPTVSRSSRIIQVHINGAFINNFRASFYGRYYTPELLYAGTREIPLTAQRFIKPYIKLGAFLGFDLEASVGLGYTDKRSANYLFQYVISDGQLDERSTQMNREGTGSEVIERSVDIVGVDAKGSVKAGLTAEIGVKLLEKCLFINQDIASLSGSFQAGICGELNLEFPILSTKFRENSWLYNTLKNNYFAVYPYMGGDICLKVLGRKVKIGALDLSYEHVFRELTLFKLSLVPEFNNFKLERQKDNLSTVSASTDITNFCVFPWTVGFLAQDPNSEKYKEIYNDVKYYTPFDYTNYNLTLEDISTAKNYEVTPSLKLADWVIPTDLSENTEKIMTVKTGKAKDISSVEATLTAVAEKVGNYDAEKGKYNFKVTPIDASSPTPNIEVVNKTQKGSKIEFEIKAKGLMPETKYNYQAYVEIDDEKVEGEILSFETKKSTELGFEIKYAPILRSFSSVGRTKSDMVNFEFKLYPKNHEREDMKLISYGSIIYKNGEEVNRTDYMGPEHYETSNIDIHVSEMTLDYSNYTAIADKSKWETSLFCVYQNKKGEKIEIESNRETLKLIYQQKPEIIIFDATSYPSCKEDEYTKKHSHEVNYTMKHLMLGGLWWGDFVRDRDEMDGDSYHIGIVYEYTTGHSGNFIENNKGIPNCIYVEFKDINGYIVRSNAFVILRDGSGCPINSHFEDYSIIDKMNNWY